MSMRQDDELKRIERGPNYRIRQEFRACSNSTTFSCLFWAASVRGVTPDLLEPPGLTPPRPNSSFTTPSWPFPAAHESGVRPYFVSGVSVLTSSRSNSSLTTPSWPPAAAQAYGHQSWPNGITSANEYSEQLWICHKLPWYTRWTIGWEYFVLITRVWILIIPIEWMFHSR